MAHSEGRHSPLEKTKLEHLFETVAALVRKTTKEESSSSDEEIANEIKLKLYGLYKHATEGECRGDNWPSVLQAVARSKYQAWEACKLYTRANAMKEYVQILATRNDKIGRQCQELLEEFQRGVQEHCNELDTRPDVSQNQKTPAGPRSEFSELENTGDEKKSSFLYSWIVYLFGLARIRPLIPRGLLDISFSDLAYALYHCLRWRFSVERCIQLNDQICQVWKEATGHDSVVGLSVRSLFDTYLCSKNYSDQSEVIVFPPISVPGMMHVAKFHNLRIVPVDIEEIDWWNSKGIQESINERTVAIMLVHPFGMLAVSDSQLIELRQLADKHRLELWEDCAECFTGLGKDCYLGSPVSDLRFFSFGMIKTATALGGGVAIFRDAKVAKQIQRSQLLLHKRQTALAFLRRILLSAILNFVGSSPLRVGLLAALCSACGLNFDKVITSAVRGFQVANPPKNEDKRDRLIQSHLVRQIRQQPSQCLLALLFRRFQQSLEMAPSVADRLKRCQHMNEMLRSISPDILISNKPNVFHTYWSFPISCHDRDTVSQYLHRLGFDVVSGASQLCCVSSCTNEQYQCPRTKDLMNSILYLPIASQHLSDKDIFRLADALRYEARGDEHLLFDAVGHNCNFRDETTKQWPQMIGIFVFFLSSTGVFVGLAPMLQSLVWMIVTAFGLWSLYIFLSLLLLHILRYMTAEFYLNKSTSFSENCDMVDAATFEGPIDASMAINTRNKVLSQIDALKIPTRVLENEPAVGSKVILTGATGFVGSLLLRELLFYRERLSVSGVIVLCRRKRRDSASTRISRLLAKPMFSFLSETEKKELVDVVEGDVTKSFAGLCEADISRIFQDASISYVIHSAASVSFTQDLPEAARSNITSSLNMQSFASELKNKNAQFVHISTAFVHGDLCGSESFPLQEALFPLGPFEAGQIYKSMLGTQFYATKAMSELRFHNTYTFSKCVCEHLLMQKNDNNTMIIRPSIVGPAVETPFEGWAGEKPSTIVAGACLHLSHQWNIWYLEPRPVAYIPVDVLAHFVLSKLFEERQNSPSSDAASSSDSSFEQIGRISDTSSDYDEASTSTNSTNKNEYQRHRILNATWDTASNNHAVFSWLEFSVAYLHLGCVLGYFKRTTAYLSLLAGAQVMPTLVPSNYFYDQVHSIFIRAPMQAVMSLCGLIGYSTEGFTELFSFLDLPLLFFPFVKNSFCFQSDLVAPKCFDPKRYVFSCGVAAHRFLSATRTKTNENISSSCRRAIPGDQPSLSTVMVGGRACHVGSSDFWWAFSQPKGGYLIRFMAFLFIKILRAVCSVVTVDVTSFRGVLSSIKSQQSRRVFLVLAPTHRSFFDFILLSYVFFALPELQIDIPFIVAADDFERLPVIGWLARLLQAFYVHRGRGYEDPRLTTSLTLMKERNLTTDGACLEVFLEGTRSRDRRFVEPKTGFLKSLKQSGGEHMFIPITINYETLPEQSFMSDEASGTYRGGLRLSGMIGWLKVRLASVWCCISARIVN